MIVQLTSKEIQKYLPYKITNEANLATYINDVYKREGDIHTLAAFFLHTASREHFCESQFVGCICIADAFLRKNKKKINPWSVTEAQQTAKAVTVFGQIAQGKLNVGDIRNWLIWHVVDLEWNDDVWGFNEDEKDLLSILTRFETSDGPKVK